METIYRVRGKEFNVLEDAMAYEEEVKAKEEKRRKLEEEKRERLEEVREAYNEFVKLKKAYEKDYRKIINFDNGSTLEIIPSTDAIGYRNIVSDWLKTL